MENETITLIVKSAIQSVPDHHVVCTMDWTVLKLKENLASSFPSRPTVEEQRLIYSGKLMFDHLVLKSVLIHPSENSSYTIHLVCSPSHNIKTTTTPPQPHTVPQPMASNTFTEQDATDTSSVRRRTAATVVPTSDSTNRSAENIDTATVYPISQLVPNTMVSSISDPVQQMAAMQQMYAQYMASYMNYMQMSGGAGGFAFPQTAFQLSTPSPIVPAPTPSSSAPSVVAAADNNDSPVEPQPAQEQAQPQAVQPAQQQPIRMNAQGGEVGEEEDDEGRDWLDYAYLASRIVVLLFIVYFYSTLSRFMIVIFTGLMIYLYQAGWFRPTRRVEQVQPPPPEAEPQPIPVDPVDAPEEIVDDRNNNIQNSNNNDAQEIVEEQVIDASNQNNDDIRRASQGEVEIIPPRPSLITLSWTFLTTFFTSLIPEQPQIT